MVCLEQVYMIFLNLADNHYQQDYNEPVLIQQSLNEVHFHHSYFSYFTLSAFETFSAFRC